MMAGFDLSGDVFSENEQAIANAIAQLDALHEISSGGDPIPPDDLKALKDKLLETQGIVRQAELSVYGSSSNPQDARKRVELESRLDALQQEYEDLLNAQPQLRRRRGGKVTPCPDALGQGRRSIRAGCGDEGRSCAHDIG